MTESEVWDVPGLGFGDLWTTMQFCLRRSESLQAPVFVCREYDGVDVGQRMHEMLALIDTPPQVVAIPTYAKPTREIRGECWSTRYFPCKIRWRAPRRHSVCFQFDGRSSADLKNPPASDITYFHRWALAAGYTPVRVGLPLTIAECALALADCDLFLGVCSGMATLAHSVGTPCHILQYGIDVKWWHGLNPITIHNGVGAFLADMKGRATA